MAKYRAIVSINIDDDDLAELGNNLGIDYAPEITEALNGELDNFGLGSCWIEQIFRDKQPIIHRLSGGITVEVTDFEE
jgi:hypothetical protein